MTTATDGMGRTWSLTVVVPTYRGGLALWLGLGGLLRWRHPAVHRLQVVVVDDASPASALRPGVVDIAGVELVVLVNPGNLGKARACRRGLDAAAGDWVLFLEDDLLAWPGVASAVADHLSDELDLVSVARLAREPRPGALRRAAQPVLRWLVRQASGFDLVDPSSPLKAARRAAFPATLLDRWRDALDEGLVLESRRVHELTSVPLRWDGRPSRYRPAAVLTEILRLAPRVAARAAIRRGRTPEGRP